jgi:hypothetical protein
MAYSLTEYILLPQINLHGIVNIPSKLDSTMFVHQGDYSVLDPTLFPDILYCTGGATASSGSYVTVNSSGSGTVGLVAGTTYMYTMTSKSSVQKPISVGTIKTLLNVSINDVDGLCKSSAINQSSPNKPNGAEPNSLSEFLNYCHTASAGLSIVQNSSDTDCPVLNSSYNLGCSIEINDTLPIGFDGSQGVKVDFFNNTTSSSIATLIDSTPMNYFKIFSTTSTNKSSGGNNSININVYMKKISDEQYYLITTTNYNLFIEMNTSYSFSNPSYYTTTFNLITKIVNGSSVPQIYDIELSILNGNTWSCDDVTPTIQPSNTWNGTLSFTTTHTINISTDLYTVRYRLHGSPTWNNWCTNVPYSYFSK